MENKVNQELLKMANRAFTCEKEYKEVLLETIKTYSQNKDKAYIEQIVKGICESIEATIISKGHSTEFDIENLTKVYIEILFQYLAEEQDLILGILRANTEIGDILDQEYYSVNHWDRIRDLEKKDSLFFGTFILPTEHAFISYRTDTIKNDEGEVIHSYIVRVYLMDFVFDKGKNKIKINRNLPFQCACKSSHLLFERAYKDKKKATKKIKEILEANRAGHVLKPEWVAEMSGRLQKIAGIA